MMDIEDLESRAKAITSLEDFGEGTWRKGLDKLLESALAEARLNDAGMKTLASEIQNQLINRLEIEDWVKRHPEVRQQDVGAPIIMATLPRTGQTAAGWLLDRDPNNRALYSWQVKRPVPPPLPGNNDNDTRITEQQGATDKLPDDLRRMHLSNAKEPDECHFLISNAFRGAHQIYSMYVPSYYQWSVEEADMDEAYAYYRLQLQLLQSKTPGQRWILKNSPHLLHLDQLHAALPTARYVQFHRNPLSIVASNCHLTFIIRSMRSEHVDRHEIGRSMLQLLKDYVDKSMQFRDKAITEPWVDIDFESFVDNPMRAVERIYDELEITLTNKARASMAEWVKQNPRDSRRPDPDLSPFGLDTNQVRKVFADYCDRFELSM